MQYKNSKNLIYCQFSKERVQFRTINVIFRVKRNLWFYQPLRHLSPVGTSFPNHPAQCKPFQYSPNTLKCPVGFVVRCSPFEADWKFHLWRLGFPLVEVTQEHWRGHHTPPFDRFGWKGRPFASRVVIGFYRLASFPLRVKTRDAWLRLKHIYRLRQPTRSWSGLQLA